MLYDIRRIAEHREILTDKKIKKIMDTLTEDLNAFIAKEYIKYSDSDGRIYTAYLDAQNAKAKFLQEIIENVDGIAPEVKKEIMSLVDDTYTKSYKGMFETLKKADTPKGFEYITEDIEVNPKVLKQAVNNNISKLTLPAVLEKHRQDLVYQLQQEITTGLMLGERYENIAKRITERVDVSYGKANNIIKTETHRNIESGFLDAGESIQGDLGNSGLIYAATWRTMRDERVRPNKRVKTKKGWKTTRSKNGANHIKMEGQTVKVGELFNLGNGVKAKCPGQSGVAAHDCRCRCFLEYNLMTAEEFAKATNQTEEQVRKKYNMKLPQEDTKRKNKTMTEQYKETVAQNEYDFFSEEQEKFRYGAIQELSGFDDIETQKVLEAFTGTRAQYLSAANSGTLDTMPNKGWFYGGDSDIRLGAAAEAMEKAKVIDRYIEAAPKYKGEIYRGLALDGDTLNSFVVGGKFSDTGTLASWTDSKDIAEMFAIGRGEELSKIPTIIKTADPSHGTPVQHLSIFGNDEREVLVSNISTKGYTVSNISKENGITIITLDEVR